MKSRIIYSDFERSPNTKRFLSLDIDDIPGAKPRATRATKNFSHYEKQLSNDTSPFRDSLERQLNHQSIFGNREKNKLHQHQVKSGKKHYVKHWDSEIGETNIIKRKEEQRNSKIETFDYPRNLVIDDIPGAKAGSLKSKTLQNHHLAEILRQNAPSKARPVAFINNNYSRDESLDKYSFRQSKQDAAVKYDYSHSFNPALGRPSALNNLLKNQRINEMNYRNKNEYSFPSLPQLKPQPQLQAYHHSGRMINDDENKYYADHEDQQNYLFSQDMNPDSAGLPSKPSHLMGKRHSSVPHLRNREGYGVILQDYEGSIQRDSSGWENPPSSLPKQYNHEIQQQQQFPPMRKQSLSTQRLASIPIQNHHERAPEQGKDLKKKITFYNIISNQANTKAIPADAKLPYRYGIAWSPEHPQSRGFDKRNAQNIAMARVQQNYQHIDALDQLKQSPPSDYRHYQQNQGNHDFDQVYQQAKLPNYHFRDDQE